MAKVQSLYDATTGDERFAAHEFMVKGFYLAAKVGHLPAGVTPFERAFSHDLTAEQRTQFRISNTKQRRAAA
jgi:hypothetical protein